MEEVAKETKEVVIKNIRVPGGVVVSGKPSFSSDAFIRLTEKGGELFPWIKTEMNDGAFWFGGTGEGWVPTKPGKKKEEPRTFLGPLREEVRGTFQRPLPEPGE